MYERGKMFRITFAKGVWPARGKSYMMLRRQADGLEERKEKGKGTTNTSLP